MEQDFHVSYLKTMTTAKAMELSIRPHLGGKSVSRRKMEQRKFADKTLTFLAVPIKLMN